MFGVVESCPPGGMGPRTTAPTPVSREAKLSGPKAANLVRGRCLHDGILVADVRAIVSHRAPLKCEPSCDHRIPDERLRTGKEPDRTWMWSTAALELVPRSTPSGNRRVNVSRLATNTARLPGRAAAASAVLLCDVWLLSLAFRFQRDPTDVRPRAALHHTKLALHCGDGQADSPRLLNSTGLTLPCCSV